MFVVDWLGPWMRQVQGLLIAPWQGAILGVDMGHTIVTSGDFGRSCTKVREAIKLPFEVVRGVGPGIGLFEY